MSPALRIAFARYEEARAGTLRLSPHAALTTLLERDYAKMQEVIFDEPPSFDWILERIAVVEAYVNPRPPTDSADEATKKPGRYTQVRTFVHWHTLFAIRYRSTAEPFKLAAHTLNSNPGSP